MITIYDMSTGTFETVSGNSTTKNSEQDYNACELHTQGKELQLLDISPEVTSDKNMMSPELAAMDSEAFLCSMKK